MIRIFILICFFSLSCIAQTLIVKTKQANVREFPSSSSRIKFRVKQGARLVQEMPEDTNGWYAVRNPKTNQTGWIQRSTIIKTEAINYEPPIKKMKASNYNGEFDKFVKEAKTTDFSAIYKDEWFLYAIAEGRAFYYNPSKGHRIGDVVTIWSETKDRSDYETLAKGFYEINCSAKQYRVISVVVYYSIIEGSVPGKFTKTKLNIPQTSTFSDARFEYLIPDSVGEALANKACILGENLPDLSAAAINYKSKPKPKRKRK